MRTTERMHIKRQEQRSRHAGKPLDKLGAVSVGVVQQLVIVFRALSVDFKQLLCLQHKEMCDKASNSGHWKAAGAEAKENFSLWPAEIECPCFSSPRRLASSWGTHAEMRASSRQRIPTQPPLVERASRRQSRESPCKLHEAAPRRHLPETAPRVFRTARCKCIRSSKGVSDARLTKQQVQAEKA